MSDNTIVHYHHILKLKKYHCGCVRGRADYTHDCKIAEQLYRNHDVVGYVQHLHGAYDEVEYQLTSSWDSEDRSRVYGKEETAHEMLLRMCPPKEDKS